MEDNFSLKKTVMEIRDGFNEFVTKHNLTLKHVKKHVKVLVPKKLGRDNPDFIKTDNFNLAKTLETINTVASTVQNVSNTVQQVNASVSTQANTVKATVQTPPANTNPLFNAGYKLLTNNNPLINNGYNESTPITGQPIVLQAEPKFDMNTMLLVGGVLIVVIMLVLVNRK